MFSSFGISHYITGLVLAVILALIIIGGIKRIAQVTEKLTPFMAIVYVLGWVPGIDTKLAYMGLLAIEWLVLIAARYLSKRSSNSAQYNGYNGRRR